MGGTPDLLTKCRTHQASILRKDGYPDIAEYLEKGDFRYILWLTRTNTGDDDIGVIRKMMGYVIQNEKECAEYLTFLREYVNREPEHQKKIRQLGEEAAIRVREENNAIINACIDIVGGEAETYNDGVIYDLIGLVRDYPACVHVIDIIAEYFNNDQPLSDYSDESSSESGEDD